MTLFRSDRIRLAGVAATAALFWLTPAAHAQQSFNSPDDAVAALASAVKSGIRQDIIKVLGPDGEDIVSSGDETADKAAREMFTATYDAKHSVKVEGKRATLFVGTDDFPFAIPLFHAKSGWEFDTKEGRQEVLFRRIGRNELDTIQTCLAFVDAQDEYADKDRGDGAGVYAQRIVSSPGKTDGLYWPSDKNDSPLGALAAEASLEGYQAGSEPKPYHGYYYRVLTQQGASAPGGAMNYIALVAWPADYANSGVVTFIVSHSGIVYEKDLGENTAAVARSMTSFDPDKSWRKVEQAAP
jgi:hypothetical protein